MENAALFARVEREIALRHTKNVAEQERRIAECRRLDPGFAALWEQQMEAAVAMGHALYGAPEGDAATGQAVLHYRRLCDEQIKLLAKYGKPADYFKPLYDCPICMDTGFVDNARCVCAKKTAARLAVADLNAASPLKTSRFADFDLSYYSDEVDERCGRAPREVMQEVFDCMKRYADGFSPQSASLLLWGDPGLGKTHLALAAAGEIAAKGYSVVYTPTHMLFNKLEKERFAKDADEDTIQTVLSCDLLVLDDLGTEFITSFVQTQLYNIINTRLLTDAPTIVSTNLDFSGLREKYPQRLISRLTGSYEDLLFLGRDIRMIKKYS